MSKNTPSVQKQRPLLMKISQVIICYTVILVSYAEYWKWQRPQLTQTDLYQAFWEWTIPIIIMILVHIGYWYYDDVVALREYKKHDNL